MSGNRPTYRELIDSAGTFVAVCEEFGFRPRFVGTGIILPFVTASQVLVIADRLEELLSPWAEFLRNAVATNDEWSANERAADVHVQDGPLAPTPFSDLSQAVMNEILATLDVPREAL